jgi:hypothetical protein
MRVKSAARHRPVYVHRVSPRTSEPARLFRCVGLIRLAISVRSDPLTFRRELLHEISVASPVSGIDLRRQDARLGSFAADLGAARLGNARQWRSHPLDVRGGEQVEIAFDYRTATAHPLHLLGRHFQVVSLNGERFAGAARDTVLVPSRGSVTIAFDASNPGKMALHRHPLYPMAGGMMMNLDYRS